MMVKIQASKLTSGGMPPLLIAEVLRIMNSDIFYDNSEHKTQKSEYL